MQVSTSASKQGEGRREGSSVWENEAATRRITTFSASFADQCYRRVNSAWKGHWKERAKHVGEQTYVWCINELLRMKCQILSLQYRILDCDGAAGGHRGSDSALLSQLKLVLQERSTTAASSVSALGVPLRFSHWFVFNVKTIRHFTTQKWAHLKANYRHAMPRKEVRLDSLRCTCQSNKAFLVYFLLLFSR